MLRQQQLLAWSEKNCQKQLLAVREEDGELLLMQQLLARSGMS